MTAYGQIGVYDNALDTPTLCTKSPYNTINMSNDIIDSLYTPVFGNTGDVSEIKISVCNKIQYFISNMSSDGVINLYTPVFSNATDASESISVYINRNRTVLGTKSLYNSILMLPVWAYDFYQEALSGNLVAFPDVSGAISGTTKLNNVLTPNIVVQLYYNVNGRCITQTKTDANGAFSFIGLEKGHAYYTVVAYYPNLNAISYNEVIPL